MKTTRSMDEMINTLPQSGEWTLYKSTMFSDGELYCAMWEESIGHKRTRISSRGATPDIALDKLLKELGR